MARNENEAPPYSRGVFGRGQTSSNVASYLVVPAKGRFAGKFSCRAAAGLIYSPCRRQARRAIRNIKMSNPPQGRVTFLNALHEMPALEITTAWSTAEIYQQGAHVTR